MANFWHDVLVPSKIVCTINRYGHRGKNLPEPEIKRDLALHVLDELFSEHSFVQ